MAQFDALYTIWRRLENVDPDEVTPLEPTTRRKLAKGVGHLAISVATAGLIEIIAPLNALIELWEESGWGERRRWTPRKTRSRIRCSGHPGGTTTPMALPVGSRRAGGGNALAPGRAVGPCWVCLCSVPLLVAAVREVGLW